MTETNQIPSRPLAGLSVGLSVSESDESAGLGFNVSEVNNTVRLISETLLSQGARLVFGHDWRPEGVMEKVYNFALNYVPLEGGEPLITNFVPWPRKPVLAPDAQQRMSGVLKIEQPGFPESAPAAASDAFKEIVGLTYMRRALVDACDFRLCIGGRKTGSSGRFAGVAEEAFLTAVAGKPMYLSGLFGGAAGEVIAAIREGKVDSEAFRPSVKVAAILEENGVLKSDSDDFKTGTAVGEFFSEMGLEKLSQTNGLTPDENVSLFDAKIVNDVISWLLLAMKRVSGRE